MLLFVTCKMKPLDSSVSLELSKCPLYPYGYHGPIQSFGFGDPDKLHENFSSLSESSADHRQHPRANQLNHNIQHLAAYTNPSVH